MSKNLNNIFLLLVLVALCFMIKCKLDSDQNESNLDNKGAKKIEHLENDNTPQRDKVINTVTEIKKTEEQATPEVQQIVKKETPPVKKVPAKQKVKTKRKSQATKKTIKKKSPKPIIKTSPKIEFEELVWDFGEITEGDVIEKKFKFTNTGNATLEIISTSATCGCTRPTFPFIDINPGESNVIGIKYHSVGKDGDQNPEITVETNSTPKFIILKLFGTVTPKPKEEEIDLKTDSLKIEKDSSAIKN